MQGRLGDHRAEYSPEAVRREAEDLYELAGRLLGCVERFVELTSEKNSTETNDDQTLSLIFHMVSRIR